MTSVRRRWLPPEVVQTSSMDCGPAALKILLEGHGISVSYGRLREACQTNVDGTSIDTIEDVARQLGLDAEQIMVPVDHIFVDESGSFPAILVLISPGGLTHFVVAWNRIAGLVQIIDPAVGRRWTSEARLRSEICVHAMAAPADGFCEWARSDEFSVVLRRRLEKIGCGAFGGLVDEALAEPGWRAIATLDACTRMVTSLVETGSLRSGAEAAGTLRALWSRQRAGEDVVPDGFWTARPIPPEERTEGEEGEQVRMRGAVLVRVTGVRADREADGAGPLTPELVRALDEPPSRPLRDLIGELRRDGLLAPVSLVAATAVAVLCAALEVLLFRGVLDIGRRLGVLQQRLGAGGVLIAFALIVLFLELAIEGGVLRMGRRLETRFRIAFQTKIPRLGDRYFQSRPSSDMAERAHNAHAIRTLPELGATVLRSCLELAVVTAGLVWIDPRSAPLAVATAVAAVAIPILAGRALSDRDLKVRTHAGALARFHLEALLALTPIRAHGAERALRREHESLLTEWMRAGRALVRAATGATAVQTIASSAMTIPLVLGHVARSSEPTTLLLFAYWALSLPVVAEELAGLVRQYPSLRNRTVRLVEPLGAIEEESASFDAGKTAKRDGGVAITLEGVSVVAGGHTILDDVSVVVAPGEHVAVVGGSGAGKSSLVGLLLGWQKPASGRLLVDGEPPEGDRLAALRRVSAWIDPTVHVWNASLYENLRYGNDGTEPVGSLVGPSGLLPLVERLPEGLQTSLGEGGTLVSGGEGQRVRFARALGREGVRLAILDEPFRGLDRRARTRLLETARTSFASATMFFVSHDIADTLSFERVLVVADGHVVEDGDPRALAADESSHYGRLLDADRRVQRDVWNGGGFRRIVVEEGAAVEEARS